MTEAVRTYYCVAGHTFAVRAADRLLLSLENMRPFVVSSVEDPLFCIDIIQCEIPASMSIPPQWVDMPADDMPRIEVYSLPDAWLFRIAIIANAPVCCELRCSRDFRSAQLSFAPDEPDSRFCIDNALMLLYAFRTASLRTLEMHAAVVVKDGQGFLFLGRSGTGKSTHARLWLQAYPDAWLLNDDNPILRVMDNGEVLVFGSPWSGKTPCYKNASAPVATIVKLSQAPENTLRRLRLPEAYAGVLSSASGLKTEPKMADEIYKTIRHIVTHIPCYQLDCLPDTDAARMCYGERQ